MAAIPTCVLLLLIAVYNVEGVCQDKNSNCFDFAVETCTQYPSWAKLECARFCKLCTSASHCPPGWTHSPSDSTCLRVYGREASASKSWYDARTACKNGGGSLAIVKSAKKNILISKIVNDSEYYWIGVKNVDPKGGMKFKYVNGFPMTYSNWKFDQPDNYQNKEHCVIFLAVNAKWSDYDCLSKNAYVCQKAAN